MNVKINGWRLGESKRASMGPKYCSARYYLSMDDKGKEKTASQRRKLADVTLVK